LDAWEAPGFHLIGWDGTDEAGIPVASGIYFCRFQAGGFRQVQKMVLLK
jgi:hypothetical protein